MILLASINVATADDGKQYFSAGRIEDGAAVQIFEGRGVATYTENYNTGLTTFQCQLSPNESSNQIVIASVLPGKNFGDLFETNKAALLMPGIQGKGTDNKTFKWRLDNNGIDDAGNIKVFLIYDSSSKGATVQCKGTYSP